MFFLLIYHLAKTDYSFHKCKGERSIRHFYFLIVLNVCPCMLSLAPATKDGYLIWDQMSSHCHFARKVRCIVSADYTICEEATWKLPFVLPLNPSNSESSDHSPWQWQNITAKMKHTLNSPFVCTSRNTEP